MAQYQYLPLRNGDLWNVCPTRKEAIDYIADHMECGCPEGHLHKKARVRKPYGCKRCGNTFAIMRVKREERWGK